MLGNIFRYYILALALLLFINGVYLLITGRYKRWSVHGGYFFAEGHIVRWYGLSILPLATLVGISCIKLDLLETLVPYTLLMLLVAAMIGLIVHSRSTLIRKE